MEHQMIFDCPWLGCWRICSLWLGAGAAENFVFQLKGFVAVGIGSSAAEGFLQSGLKVFGVHSWLIL